MKTTAQKKRIESVSSVTLTLTPQEAAMLRFISYHNVSVPETLVSKFDGVKKEELKTFLTELNRQLLSVDVGFPG